MARSSYKVNLVRCWVTWYEIGFGVTQFTCFDPRWPSPVGIVWAIISAAGNSGKSKAHLHYIYTMSWARRQGVCSLIFDTIFQHADVLVTDDATKKGAAFMRARGWCFEQRSGLWTLTRFEWKRNQCNRRTIKTR